MTKIPAHDPLPPYVKVTLEVRGDDGPEKQVFVAAKDKDLSLFRLLSAVPGTMFTIAMKGASWVVESDKLMGIKLSRPQEKDMARAANIHFSHVEVPKDGTRITVGVPCGRKRRRTH